MFKCKLVRQTAFLEGALLLCPCLFRPSDNVWRSRRADAPQCVHFSTVISPSWITEQISVVRRTKACQRVGSAKQVSKLSLGQNITRPETRGSSKKTYAAF